MNQIPFHYQRELSSQAQRIALLAKQNEQIFHVRDLANLWGVSNQNTLYTILKRYVKSQLIYRIYKGFYSTIDPEKIEPVLIGAKALHQYCYLSTETVLFRAGYISQKVEAFTFISAQSQKFKIGKNAFISRQMADKFLYQMDGIQQHGSVKIATLERAIADMLYFNPFFHFYRPVQWDKIKRLQQKIGYPLTPQRYDSSTTN